MGPGNRPLDLEWLEDFLALAESGNFSRAAQQRLIAQPAFSRHIRSLEEWVGVDLFDRSTHPASLTEAGLRLQPLIEDLLARLEAARIKARSAHEQGQNSLRFAATHVLSLTYFPQWLSGVEAQLRIGAIQMFSDHFQSCEESMLQRRVQFLLCHGHEGVRNRLDEAQCPARRIGEDALVPVSAGAAPGAPLHRISRDAAAELPVLAYSLESGLGRIVRAVLGRRLDEAPFRAVFTAHHAVLLKTMALEGRGIAWLPRSLIRQELDAGLLLCAGDANWQIPVDIRLYRQPSDMSAAAEALWAFTQRAA
jgi:DNA-binding transcriptional LysR family regulator